MSGRAISTTAAASSAGRVRETNEDRWLVRDGDGTTLLAVADGVGGISGGEVASATAIDRVGERFFASVAAKPASEALSAAMRDANDAVVATARGTPGPLAASTLVAAAIRGGRACVANLGDSRAYLVHHGAARQITTDHSGDQPSSITRYVGDARGVQPDVFVERLRPGDRLVLCSDGLVRHVEDREIAAIVGASAPAPAAERLVALANERGGEDNVTVVIYRTPSRASVLAVLSIAAIATLVALAAIAVMSVGLPAAPP